MNKEKALALENELMEIINEWAKDKNISVRRKAGSYTDTYDLFTVELAEIASDGKLAMSDYDKSVMMNWLKGTPFEGRDPRGHVFGTTTKSRKYKGHSFRVETFRYGTRFPWKITDLWTGETLNCNNDFLDNFAHEV